MWVENVVVEGRKTNVIYKCDICIRLVGRHNLLCPKIIESLFILHRIIEDPRFVEQFFCFFPSL